MSEKRQSEWVHLIFPFFALETIAIGDFYITHPGIGYHPIRITGSSLNKVAFFVFYGEVIEENIRAGGFFIAEYNQKLSKNVGAR